MAILDSLEGKAAETAKPVIDDAQATLMATRLQQQIGQSIMNPVKEVVGAGAAYTTHGGGVIGTVKTVVPHDILDPNRSR